MCGCGDSPDPCLCRKRYNELVKVYLINRVRGYWVGEMEIPSWTNRRAIIQPVVAMDMRFIERDILVAYYGYLWRLGEYTFDAVYTPVGSPPEGRMSLQRFADFHYLKLWPTRGRGWFPAGASKGRFDSASVMWAMPKGAPAAVSRRLTPYNIFLRYKETLWWGVAEFVPHLGRWVCEQRLYIGRKIMFERKSARKTPPFVDGWNFGMCWWERITLFGVTNWYLWETAEVEYLGIATRRSEIDLTVKGV